MYLLDTNAVIYFLNSSLSPTAIQFLKNVVDDDSNISIITKMEALALIFRQKTSKRLWKNIFPALIFLISPMK
jgi:predicted nucleic acid-binding protein